MKRMKILIACEFSGVVREAFRSKGHDCMSCDLLPTEITGPHYIGDVRNVLYGYEWDMMIAHPPCTYLCVSGNRWMNTRSERILMRSEALDFVRLLMRAPINKIAIENPVGVISSQIRKPDCSIHPWQHGHGEVKETHLWLKNLDPILPSNVVEGRESVVHRMSPGGKRSMERSKTYIGIARAMADQWG